MLDPETAPLLELDRQLAELQKRYRTASHVVAERRERPDGIDDATYDSRVDAVPLALRAAGAVRVVVLAVGAAVVLHGVAMAAAFFAVAAVSFVVAAIIVAVAVFFAAAGRGLVSFGAAATPSTTSLNPFNGVILATVLALTLTASPVAGLRAIRAGRLTFENLANPVRATSSPLATVARITSSVPSMTFAATLGSTSVWAATAWASSRFSWVLHRGLKAVSLAAAWCPTADARGKHRVGGAVRMPRPAPGVVRRWATRLPGAEI
jgi:hypothetical protein